MDYSLKHSCSKGSSLMTWVCHLTRSWCYTGSAWSLWVCNGLKGWGLVLACWLYTLKGYSLFWCIIHVSIKEDKNYTQFFIYLGTVQENGNWQNAGNSYRRRNKEHIQKAMTRAANKSTGSKKWIAKHKQRWKAFCEWRQAWEKINKTRSHLAGAILQSKAHPWHHGWSAYALRWMPSSQVL